MKYLLIAFLYCLSNYAFSQQHPYKQFTPKEGLAAMQVMSLYEDTKGNTRIYTEKVISILDRDCLFFININQKNIYLFFLYNYIYFFELFIYEILWLQLVITFFILALIGLSFYLLIRNRYKRMLLRQSFEIIVKQKAEIESQNSLLAAANIRLKVKQEMIQEKNKQLIIAKEKAEIQKQEIEILQSSLEHDLDNDILIIQRAGKFHIKDLLKEENQNLFENLQSSLLAITDYYVFILRLGKNKDHVKINELLYDMCINILKKYNYENIIDIQTESNLNAKVKGERAALRKVMVCIAELIRNTVKHAFPKDFLETSLVQPSINIKFYKEKNNVFITYMDNGRGFPKKIPKSELGNGRGLKILKNACYEEGFLWQNREEGGIVVQMKINIDITKK